MSDEKETERASDPAPEAADVSPAGSATGSATGSASETSGTPVPEGDIVERVETVDPATGAPVTYIVVEPRMNRRGRRFLAWVCIVLAWILFMPAVVTTWADRTFLNTETFINEVRAVVKREDVENAIVMRVTDEIMALPAVQEAITDYLPDELQNFESLIINAVRSGVQRLLTYLIQSNFAQGVIDNATDRTLRRLHTQLMNGEDLTVSLTDLIGLFDFDPSSLVGGALDRVPDNFGRVTLLKKSEYPAVYTGVDLAQRVWIWLGAAAALLAIAAIAVAVERRRAVMILAFGIAIVALTLNGVIRVGSNIGFSTVDSSTQAVARDVGNTLLEGLFRSLWWWTVVGVIVGVIAALWPRIARATAAASSRAKDLATRAKDDAPDLADRAGSGLEKAWVTTKGFVEGLGLGEKSTALGHRIAENPVAFRWGVVIVCALGFLIWPTHSLGSLLFFTVLGIAAVGAVEFLLSQQRRPGAGGSAAADPGRSTLTSAGASDRYAVLERLADLHGRGILTQAEYDAEKQRVLATGT